MSNTRRPLVSLLSLLLGLAGATAAPGARAARITDVPEAKDEASPVGVNLELKTDLLFHSALLTRENAQPPPDDPTGAVRAVDVKELQWRRIRFRVRPRLQVSFYRDTAVFIDWPFVLWDQQSAGFADGTTAANSTLARDAFPNPSPTVDGWPEVEGAGNTQPAIQDGNKYGFPANPYNRWRLNSDGSFASYRQGIDNPTVGARYSPLNNAHDDTKPTVTFQVDYTPPLFGFMDPTNDVVESADAPAGVADGQHKFHFLIAMSKRFLMLDPYFQVDYTVPFVGVGTEHLEGMQPRQSGGFAMGIEIIPYEEARTAQRFAINLETNARYFSEGRDYSEISDLFREVTYTDQFMRLSGKLGLAFRTYKFFFFNLDGFASYDTEHFLTIEDFGKDLADDANEQIDLVNPNERNPFYNPAIDTVGRRLRIQQSVQLGAIAHVGLTF